MANDYLSFRTRLNLNVAAHLMMQYNVDMYHFSFYALYVKFVSCKAARNVNVLLDVLCKSLFFSSIS